MDMIQEKTYESIYYQLWELSQRYKTFTQFRVIGKSHDDRMIPMLEIGTGDTCIFCVAGNLSQRIWCCAESNFPSNVKNAGYSM